MRMMSPRIVDMASLARFMMSSDCQSITFLTGAGVSVASGIPDFRSPGGMYDTLRPELITATDRQRRMMVDDPTNVVSKEIFEQTSLPYLEVRRPFILGTATQKWKATIAHRFMELVETKTSKLKRIYTQNIDGLDYQCDKIPQDKIINVHGALSEASCEACQQPMDYGEFISCLKTQIKDIYKQDPDAPQKSTPIVCPNCGAPQVKPTTVLFGGAMPRDFFDKVEDDCEKTDLLFIAGTSLVVAPANSLVFLVPESAARVVVNMEPVGADIALDPIDYSDKNGRDFFAQGACDEMFLELIQELGWMDDLKQIIEKLPAKSAALVQQAK
mmetsp:Transcript_10399/g.14685  ORF Transcript_10399/g.14685 Transcript_10399/m.14685 type:complete len:329 (+) Transcript_10399:251-1237(+)